MQPGVFLCHGIIVSSTLATAVRVCHTGVALLSRIHALDVVFTAIMATTIIFTLARLKATVFFAATEIERDVSL